jgi:cytidine deaminase
MFTDIGGRQLVDVAQDLARRHAARAGLAEAVTAAALTRSGAVLLGVWNPAMVDSACLCAETGPICEAHVRDDPIVASACVSLREDGTVGVLPACGVCQERLRVFGDGVMIAVALDPLRYRSLGELRPEPWWDASS